METSEGYKALIDGAGWIDASERGRIVVRGRDRARFLHNLTTNNVKSLTPGSGCYAFLLNAQGRIQADALLLCFEDRFLLETEPELREKVQAYLQRYIIGDQVTLEDASGQTAEIALEGPHAAGALSALHAPVPENDYAHMEWEGFTVAKASLTGQPGYRLIGPAEGMGQLVLRLEAAGVRPATQQEARIVRIENGVPRYGEDILDTCLPQETGQMHAVSFTKGCYLGQEIVERIRARGHVNRKLTRIDLPSAEPAAPGDKLVVDGKNAEITSSVYSPRFGTAVALAYVRVE